jgi:uroporphyrinogen decarboxylase
MTTSDLPATPVLARRRLIACFAPLQNDTFLRACLRQATDRTPACPCGCMRQAGRYLPEYRDTRAKAGSFMGLATNVDYATEVTLQPLERYPLDARPSCSATSWPPCPDAMGLGLFSFAAGRRPQVRAQHTHRGRRGHTGRARHGQAALCVRCGHQHPPALNGRVPLIGFSGSPWTLACYMVEGGGSDDYRAGQDA